MNQFEKWLYRVVIALLVVTGVVALWTIFKTWRVVKKLSKEV